MRGDEPPLIFKKVNAIFQLGFLPGPYPRIASGPSVPGSCSNFHAISGKVLSLAPLLSVILFPQSVQKVSTKLKITTR